MSIEFEIGNTHKEVRYREHEWGMYIKATDPTIQRMQHNLIERVRLDLHNTCKEPVAYINPQAGKPIIYESSTWGSFDLRMTIFFKTATGRQDPHQVKWNLAFQGGGKCTRFRLFFDADKIKRLIS